MKKLSQVIFTTALFIIGSLNTASAGVMAYTDKTAWENALAGQIFATNDFNGPQQSFSANSINNNLGSGISLDLIGGVGDTGPTRINGNGFFEGEVDSSSFASGDGLTLQFNADKMYGFAFEGMQNDSTSTPTGLDLEEIGFEILGEKFLLSDILGLSNSSDNNNVPTINSTGVIPFIGFVSTSLFNSFNMLHGDFVAPGGVSGGNEEFYIDSMTTAVPAPSTAMLFAVVVLLSFRRFSNTSLAANLKR